MHIPSPDRQEQRSDGETEEGAEKPSSEAQEEVPEGPHQKEKPGTSPTLVEAMNDS